MSDVCAVVCTQADGSNRVLDAVIHKSRVVIVDEQTVMFASPDHHVDIVGENLHVSAKDAASGILSYVANTREDAEECYIQLLSAIA